MRKLIATLLILVAIPIVAQEKSVGDTIVVNRPQNVTVTRSGDGSVAISVEGREGNGAYRMKYNTEFVERDTTEWKLSLPFLKEEKQKNRWRFWAGGLYGGFLTTNCSIDGKHLQKGYEGGITHLLGAKYNFGGSGLAFETGFGLHAQMLFSTKNTVLFDSHDGHLLTLPLSEGAKKKSAWLSAVNFAIPLQFSQQMGKRFGVTLGMNLRWNVGNLAQAFYTVDGMEYSERVRDIKTRPLSYDLMGSIGWKGTSLFVKYTPKSSFRNGFGPQYEAWSIGIRFWNF